MNVIERRYLKIIFTTICLLTAFYLFCVIYFLRECFSGRENFNNNIFELIYMAVHLVILATAIIFSIQSLKQGSSFMNDLMYDERKIVSKKAKIISLVFSFLGLFALIYSTLLFFKVDIPSFHFPLGLIIILINVGLAVFIIALFFYFYPIIHGKSK